MMKVPPVSASFEEMEETVTTLIKQLQVYRRTFRKIRRTKPPPPDHSKRNREIFIMYEGGGVTYKEVGAKFGISAARARDIALREYRRVTA